MTVRRFLAGATIAAAVVLTGCATTTDGSPAGAGAGRSSVPSSANPSVTAPTSATPTVPAPSSASASTATSVAAWSLPVARQKYLSYVAPYNADIKKLNALYAVKTATVAQYQHSCQALASDQELFGAQLQRGAWPTSARAAITAFLPDTVEAAYVFRTCTRATTVAIAQATLDRLPDSTTYANAVRTALGLPTIK